MVARTNLYVKNAVNHILVRKEDNTFPVFIKELPPNIRMKLVPTASKATSRKEANSDSTSREVGAQQ